MKVKKGDIVHILRGKDAGKEGRVLEALPKQGRVVVENINVVKRHRRPRPIQNTTGMGGGGMTPGGIIDLAVCPNCGKPTRVGTVERTVKDKVVRVRVCKHCGEDIDRT
jgi:large subunit ribosomal protein L24